MDHILSVSNLSYYYQDGDTRRYILNNATQEFERGKFYAILGASGSGKTTFLALVSALDDPMEGSILYDGADIKSIGSESYRRNKIGIVFQAYNLIPYMTAVENVLTAMSITDNKLPSDRRSTAYNLLQYMGIDRAKADRRINKLSGGEQQRVAIARALVNRPKVLLLDEPLGALDLKLRKEMQIELKRIQQALEITFIYVTHDQEEALTMSDRVVVMRDGNILQIGTPQDIYNEPCNAFVADFIGESNIIDGIMHKDFLVEFANDYFDCVDKGFEPKERVQVVVRPEDFKIVPADKGKISGIVESIIFKGVHYEIMVDAMGYKWKIHTTQYVEPGTLIGMDVAPMDIHIMKRTEE